MFIVAKVANDFFPNKKEKWIPKTVKLLFIRYLQCEIEIEI